jgi:hypothetical protein
MADFELDPAFTTALTGSFQGASAGITSAFSAATPAMVSGFCMPMGPLGVGNIIPAIVETMSTNCTSGLMNAATHGVLGGATSASQSTFIARDSV